jgi:hypothetical protein
MIRVFPTRNKWTPTDGLSFVGYPPLFLPPEQPVRICVTFTWDIPLANKLYSAWSNQYKDVQIGGPAFDDEGGEFEPGRFIKDGVTITSRGCPNSCAWCFVPGREGNIRELQIKPGDNIIDNNLLACSKKHIHKVFDMCKQLDKPITFSGGLDARLLRPWHIDLLKSIKVAQMFFACDSPEMVSRITDISVMLKDFPLKKKRCFVLVGFDGDSICNAEGRLIAVSKAGYFPYAMRYQDMTNEKKHADEFSRLARIWSRPRITGSIMNNLDTASEI